MDKAVFTILLIVFFFGKNNAQYEIKTETVGALFGRYYLSMEYLAANNFSFELGAGGHSFNAAKSKGAHLLLMTKYYFRTFRGHDELYIGVYGKPLISISTDFDPIASGDDNIRKSGFAYGAILGRKWRWFGNENLTIDLQTGLGIFYGRRIRTIAFPSPTPFFFTNESDVDFVFNFTVGYRFFLE